MYFHKKEIMQTNCIELQSIDHIAIQLPTWTWKIQTLLSITDCVEFIYGQVIAEKVYTVRSFENKKKKQPKNLKCRSKYAFTSTFRPSIKVC